MLIMIYIRNQSTHPLIFDEKLNAILLKTGHFKQIL